MNNFKHWAFAGVVACLVTPALLAQPIKIKKLDDPAPAQVLFVGNSYFYYNDSLHNHVNRLVQAHDKGLAERIAYKSATIGGAALNHHDVAGHLELGRLGLEKPFDLVILKAAAASHCANHAAVYSPRLRGSTARQYARRVPRWRSI